ncbi:hypothetical protein WN55_05458, partial [Dufourea novaeangliae]
VKLPPFWKQHPAFWFAQVETAFDLARVTSDLAKFRHVVVNLDGEIWPLVADLVAAPPSQGKYNSLKKRIIESFDESSESKLRRLLRGNVMGVERPSVYLQRLRNLSSGQCSDTVLRTLFLEQLPENVRAILAISEGTDLCKLALQANKIYEILGSGVSTVNEVRDRRIEVDASSSPPSSAAANCSLRDQLEEITQRLRRLETRATRRGSPAGGSAHGNRSSSAHGKHSRSRDGFCRLHAKYGAQARRCFPPCRWSAGKRPENW